MTTIKLNKKPDEPLIKASKAPVRRTDAARRDRSVAPSPKVVAPARAQVEPTRAEARVPSVTPASPTRQRNHRFDGKLHGDENVSSDASSADARPTEYKQSKPRSSEGAPERTYDRPANRPAERQARPAGIDTRTTPKSNKDEPQYRQAPRRGGKVRDGYDAVNTPQYGAAAKAAYKSVAVSTDLPRLSKVMAERGICSRREADEWILNNWVMVDGVIIDTLGTRINPDAEIIISSYAHEVQSESVTIILHKPVGYVSGQAEDDYQPAIVLVHPDNEWIDDPELNQHHHREFQRRYLNGLAPAGRLDIDSTGMLVLTQDGRVARHLIGENSTVEKEYLVRVEGSLTEANMKLLNVGLSLDGEKLKPAKVSWQNEDQLRFVLREGKKRQIRRMCEMVGLHVVGLKRVRIGSVNLGKLPVGQWRYLRNDERF
ncbi:MAG: pseudouridine synthase [Methylotenera sp.]